MSVPPFSTPAKFTVTVGAGLVQVLQLDDQGQRDWYPITLDWTSGRGVKVTGTVAALQRLRKDCQRRMDGGYDQPAWYARSAQAAVKAITKVLDSTT